MPRRTSREDPNQLKMFMTPEEIHHNYEPLEGDFEETGDYERTSRPMRSTRLPGQFTSDLKNVHDPDQTKMAYAGGTGDYVRMPRTETHEEFWDRKRDEAQMDPIDYAESRQQVGSHTNPHFDISAALNRSSAPKAPEGRLPRRHHRLQAGQFRVEGAFLLGTKSWRVAHPERESRQHL